jgi:hypothetical protein
VNQGISVAIAGVMPAARLTGLFRDVVTFQLPLDSEAGFTDTGFPTGVFVDAPGLVNLAAIIAPTSVIRISGQTVKTDAEQKALNSSHLLLAGYYPDAEAAWRSGARVVVNGDVYPNDDVLAVESDSQHTQTRVEIRVATL